MAAYQTLALRFAIEVMAQAFAKMNAETQRSTEVLNQMQQSHDDYFLSLSPEQRYAYMRKGWPGRRAAEVRRMTESMVTDALNRRADRELTTNN